MTGLVLAAGCTGETSGVTDVAVVGAAGGRVVAFAAGDFEELEAGASVAGFAVGAPAGGRDAKPRSISSIQWRSRERPMSIS